MSRRSPRLNPQQCDAWKENDWRVNPVTGKPMTPFGRKQDRWRHECGHDPKSSHPRLRTVECQRAAHNPRQHPVTQRAARSQGKMFQHMKNTCAPDYKPAPNSFEMGMTWAEFRKQHKGIKLQDVAARWAAYKEREQQRIFGNNGAELNESDYESETESIANSEISEYSDGGGAYDDGNIDAVGAMNEVLQSPLSSNGEEIVSNSQDSEDDDLDDSVGTGLAQLRRASASPRPSRSPSPSRQVRFSPAIDPLCGSNKLSELIICRHCKSCLKTGDKYTETPCSNCRKTQAQKYYHTACEKHIGSVCTACGKKMPREKIGASLRGTFDHEEHRFMLVLENKYSKNSMLDRVVWPSQTSQTPSRFMSVAGDWIPTEDIREFAKGEGSPGPKIVEGIIYSLTVIFETPEYPRDSVVITSGFFTNASLRQALDPAQVIERPRVAGDTARYILLPYLWSEGKGKQHKQEVSLFVVDTPQHTIYHIDTAVDRQGSGKVKGAFNTITTWVARVDRHLPRRDQQPWKRVECLDHLEFSNVSALDHAVIVCAMAAIAVNQTELDCERMAAVFSRTDIAKWRALLASALVVMSTPL